MSILKNTIDSLKAVYHTCRTRALKQYDGLNNLSMPIKGPLHILGNGKSLLNSPLSVYKDVSYLVVNRHVLSDDYIVRKPLLYVLADPHFFNHPEGISILYEIKKKTTWTLNLFVVNGKENIRLIKEVMEDAENIKVVYYNCIEVNGFNLVKDFMYNHNLGMPRPQNVIVAALYISLCLGFKNIELYGVEHSWTKDLFVDDDNNVCLYNPHFYDKDKIKSKTWYEIQHEKATIGDVLKMYAYMFDSYHEIQRLALKIGARIVNKTPKSFIDAFPRKGL